MAHYAKVNNGIVEKVIVAEASYFDTFVDDSPGEWIQTSYNTFAGVHYEPGPSSDLTKPSSDQSKALRKNYASIGYTYDKDPYQVFEASSGTRFADRQRDPRTLIDASIREIAATLFTGRLFTRRI